MIKLITLIDDPIMIAIIVAQFIYILNLRRRMAGLKDPELWLSKKERHKRALEKLEEQDAERRQARLQKDLEFIQGKNPIPNQEKQK